ncbi:ATPdependent RNA helicase [Chamberlinius hualienensis]
MDFKNKFIKPDGGETAGWTQDRKLDDDTAIPTFYYQPNKSLAVDAQRQKLPIYKKRNHLLYLIEKYQTIIVVGETGCGKSTQMPQYLMEAGWNEDGKLIGVTQPRRVAAITLATRVAEEKNCNLGEDVGYSVRFDDCWTRNKTKIKFMTEGILIREMMSDPLLSQYSVLMIDEVHERSYNTDISLGLMKKILKKRPDLRLIVASATVDAEEMQRFFGMSSSAIISVEGRTFPVDIYYVKEPVADYVQASVETALKIHTKQRPGDILVFLTGQEEVEVAIRTLREAVHDHPDELLVLPLYGALTAREQLRVFRRPPLGTRKVVFTTNIAEASLTIFGIVYIIDCGFVKLRHFNPATATDSLVVIPISQASAEQRAGRAGRTRSGMAYRLYMEDDFHNLISAVPPEIQRANLAFPILQLKALGIENVLRFNFPSPPPAQNVVCALEILYALGALDNDGNLTNPLGMQMAEFPLNPFFSKMLLISGEFGCSEEAIVITAMLQVQTVFIYPAGRNAIEARKARANFAVAEGDMLTYLNIFLAFDQNKRSRQWCQRNFLNYKALLRAVEVKGRLTRLLSKFKVPIISSDGDMDSILRCITAGFFPNAAYLHHSGDYKTLKGDHTVHLHTTSVLYTEKKPPWILFNEVLITNKEYVRDITVIEPKWLCELAPHYYQFGTVREIRARDGLDGI